MSSDSDSDEENVFNIFKSGAAFDIIEEEASSSDVFSPQTLSFLSNVERLYLKRNKDQINSLIEKQRNAELVINDIEICILQLSSLVLSGCHVYLFKAHTDSSVDAALAPAKYVLTVLRHATDVTKSTGIPDAIRDSIVEYVADEQDSYVRQCKSLLCLMVGTVFLEMYVQSNYTGPELSQEFCGLLNLPLLNETNHFNGIANLSVDGESAFRQCELPHALIIARAALSTVCDSTRMLWEHGIELSEAGNVVSKLYPLSQPVLAVKQASAALVSRHIWSFRAGIIHLRVLQRQSYAEIPSLWKDSQDNIKMTLASFLCNEFLQRSDELSDNVATDDRILISQLWLECGLCNHYFDQGDKGRSSFQKAQKCARLITELSGAIGKRTKHQVYSHAQMFLYAESRLLFQNHSDVEDLKAVAINSPALQSEFAKPGPVWEHGKYEIGKRMIVGDESTGGEEAAVREVKS